MSDVDEQFNKINISVKSRPRGAKLKVYDYNIKPDDIANGFVEFELYPEINNDIITNPYVINVDIRHVKPIPEDPDPDPDPTPTLKPFIVASVGDTRAEEEFDTIAGHIASENPLWFFSLGDYQYRENTTGKKQSSKEWCDIIDKHNLKNRMGLVLGNHEHEEENGHNLGQYIEEWFKPVYDLKANKWFRSGIVGNIFYIDCNTQDLDIQYVGREQYNKIEAALKQADSLRQQNLIEWIFVNMHKPFYTLKSVNQVLMGARHALQPLFDKYHVDVIQWGHNHDAQLWYPMSYNATPKYSLIPGTNIFDFSKPHGQLIHINGLGGRGITKFQDDEFTDSSRTQLVNKNVFWWNETQLGYTMQYVTPKGWNGNQYGELKMQFKNIKKEVLKEIIIRK